MTVRPAVTTRAPVSGALISTAETQRALASWKATGLTDEDTADIARMATARVAQLLDMPVTPHAATERFPFWGDRLALSARRVEGDAFSAATLTNVQVGYTANGHDHDLDEVLWRLDFTGHGPAVTLSTTTLPLLGPEANPVWVSYHFDPLASASASDTAALVGHCATLIMREEFAARTQGGFTPSAGSGRAADLLSTLRRVPV